MDDYTLPAGDSALDLSVLPEYSNSDVAQLPPPHVIMLPASAITISGSDNIPFYIAPSGQLILANTTVERVNEGLVFKQAPLATLPITCAQTEPQEPFDQTEFDESSGPGVSNDDVQKILGQKVSKLTSKVPRNALVPNDNVVINGYNVTKLALLADRLRRYRTTRTLSQAKLSRKITETTTGGLKFSQSFLCRFEKLDITLRAAISAQPYLEEWLDQVESEEQDTLEPGQTLSLPSTDVMTDLLDLRERIVSESLEPSKCSLPARRNRKCRAVFTETAVEQMIQHFKRNSRPRGEELSRLAESIGYERESVRIWFSNRRYQLGITSKR